LFQPASLFIALQSGRQVGLQFDIVDRCAMVQERLRDAIDIGFIAWLIERPHICEDQTRKFARCDGTEYLPSEQ
jgi:hypothetical protein